MLTILDNDSKLRYANAIDTVICADIPDPVAEPELHEVIKFLMIHGPYGLLIK